MTETPDIPQDDDDSATYEAVFNIFDMDGSKTISQAELRRIMAEHGERLTDEEVEDMINSADTTGRGNINLEDFLAVCRNEPCLR
jgi:Ca2+-binding EF-hand superfamily protein